MNEVAKLRELLHEMEEPTTNRRFIGIILQVHGGVQKRQADGLEGIRLRPGENPDFYLDEASRKHMIKPLVVAVSSK